MTRRPYRSRCTYTPAHTRLPFWRRPWRWRGPRWHVLLITALVILLGLGLMVSSTVLGIVQGVSESRRMRRQSAQFHYEQGLIYQRAGQHTLALAEFQEALRLDPGHMEAQRQLLTLLRPTPTPIPTPTPAPLVTVDPTLALQALLDKARQELDQGAWQQAYGRLEQLHTLAPDFRASEVEDLLYRAALGEGLALLAEDRLEEALRAFDRALRWKPGDREAQAQRDRAEAYILGISYFYADWDSAITIFESLYRQAPDFKDTRSRYLEALARGAAFHAEQGDPCRAVAYYDRLLQLQPTTAAQQAREEAAQACVSGP